MLIHSRSKYGMKAEVKLQKLSSFQKDAKMCPEEVES